MLRALKLRAEADAGAPSKERVAFDETNENGSLLADKRLPDELLTEILLLVDPKTLLNCQLVCKRWYLLLQNYLWRKKAEAKIGKRLYFEKESLWYLYYFICSEQLLGKNLIKNHSGGDGNLKYWTTMQSGSHQWNVEYTPQRVLLPPTDSDPVFEGKPSCFATSTHGYCYKEQTVDLISEGFFPKFLDTIQPPITVSEWYTSNSVWTASTYAFAVELVSTSGKILNNFYFEDILEESEQKIWKRVKHEFTSYGPGLRKVVFAHRGKEDIDSCFFRFLDDSMGGIKIAGACVQINLQKQIFADEEKTSDTLLNFQ